MDGSVRAMCGWVCSCVDGVSMCGWVCSCVTTHLLCHYCNSMLLLLPRPLSYYYSSPGQGARLAAQIRTTGRVCWWSSDRAYERVRREGREGEEG